jgi:peptide chain release factor subunit 1
MLTQEYGTASNIKSRVNRLSVLAAITSTQQRLKLYNRVPPNGLVLFVGTVLTDEGKEKKVSFDFEPHKPINTCVHSYARPCLMTLYTHRLSHPFRSLYLCDNKFHTEALSELLESDSRFGFIVMDGNGTLFGTLSGNTREVIHKFTVDLPKKHGRGGQSALRFSRLRDEKRHNYVRKVAELAVQHFITNDKVNVSGLVLAGSADFKTELSQSDMFDPRLVAKVIKVVDVSYGGENGFNQVDNSNKNYLFETLTTISRLLSLPPNRSRTSSLCRRRSSFRNTLMRSARIQTSTASVSMIPSVLSNSVPLKHSLSGRTSILHDMSLEMLLEVRRVFV